MAKKIDKRELFSKLSFFSKDMSSLLNTFSDQLVAGKKLQLVFTPNAEQIVLASKDPDFLQTLSQADYLLPDGMGLVWALNHFSRKGWLSNQHFVRLAGVEVAEALIKKARLAGWRVLVIGGRDYCQYSDFWTANIQWQAGYQSVKNPNSKEEQQLRLAIKNFHPDLVLVALGAPYQEKWLIEHQPLLEQSGVKLAMVVGGAMDIILGKLKRAPVLMSQLGLEWLFRLMQEPHRWRRQLSLLEFVWWVVG